jgi:hypothetical protein
MALQTSSQTRLTDDEIALRAQWDERVRRYQAGDLSALPPEVIGLGGLRVFGRAGDAVLAFPRMRYLSDLELLPPDIQFGLTLVNRTVAAHQQQGNGRMIYATAPASREGIPVPELVTTIDPTRHADVLIVAPLSGGV